ncbi:MAG: isocitrate/isopropylmalate family dehydrogenase [Chitinophagaceae bacterium]|nr:isocitrate/isopropylmalate family dehydrogenase [Chitinophagaceae bacterium]
MKKKIAVIPGDGIGPEIIRQSVNVLNAIGKVWLHEFEYIYALPGAETDQAGSFLPDKAIEACLQCDAILSGMVMTTSGGDGNPAMEKNGRPGDLAKALQLYANVRPVTVFPSLHHLSPLKTKQVQGTDLVIVRELNEAEHPAPAETVEEPDQGINGEIWTGKVIERVCHLGFQYAMQRRKKLTIVERGTPGPWLNTATEMAEQYPGVEVSGMLIENAVTELILHPQQFDVVVTEELSGNILVKETGALTGATGLLASASMGNRIALFEPVQTADAQVSGKDIANPVGSILSAAMLLEYLGMKREALAVREAVHWALKNNFVTRDMDPVNFYLTSTMGELLCEYISNQPPEELQSNTEQSTII